LLSLVFPSRGCLFDLCPIFFLWPALLRPLVFLFFAVFFFFLRFFFFVVRVSRVAPLCPSIVRQIRLLPFFLGLRDHGPGDPFGSEDGSAPLFSLKVNESRVFLTPRVSGGALVPLFSSFCFCVYFFLSSGFTFSNFFSCALFWVL